MILYNIDSFIKRLYDEGFTKEAMHFCKQVFKISNKSDDEGKIRIDRLKFKFDRYWVFKFYAKFVPTINSLDRLDLFKHLISEFGLALLELHPRQDDGKYLDFSYITRPAIEEHDNNDGLSEEHTIIQIIKEIIDLTETLDEKSTFMDLLLKEKYPVFKRLALYMLRESFDKMDKEYSSKLLNKANFSDTHLTHELYRLLSEKFSNMIQKDKVNQIISELKDIRYNHLSVAQNKEIGLEEELRWLSALQENKKSNIRSKRIKVLQNELGYELDNLDRVFYSEVKYGYDSPIPYKDLQAKSFPEIKQELLSFKTREGIDSGDFDSHEEGLSRYLESLVTERKDEFIQNINLFKDPKIKVRFIGAIYSGLVVEDNVLNKQKFNVYLDYTNWIFDMAEGGKLSFTDSDRYNLAYALKRFFHHIVKVFHNSDNIINQEYIDKTIYMLLRYSKKYSQEAIGVVNPFQEFINRPYGDYLQAWYSINLRLKNEHKISDLLPQLRELLDAGVSKDPFIHVLLGKYLPNLYYIDKNWIESNFSKIFPERADSNIWLITLKSFLWTTSLNNDLFPYLLPHLLKAGQKKFEEGQLSSLGERIGVYYLRPETHANCYKYLIKPLSENNSTNPAIFAKIASFLKNNYIENLNGNKIRKYLRYRFSFIKSNPKQLTDEIKQLVSFSKCFSKLSYSDYLMFRFALIEMDKWPHQSNIFSLFEDLIRKSEIRYLYSLVSIDLQSPIYIFSFVEEYTKIFETLYSSGDKKIQNGTGRMINKLGEQGNYQFRKIYEQYLDNKFT